jgi:hypothetical protein
VEPEPSIIQQTTAAWHSGKIGYKQKVKDKQAKPKHPRVVFFLNLVFAFDETIADIASSDEQMIEQGKKYDIVVYASDTSNPRSGQIELSSLSEIELLLECINDNDTSSTIQIENPRRVMTYQQVALRENVLNDDEEYQSFRVKVPDDCPRGNVTFRLSYRLKQSRFILPWNTAVSLQVLVDGPYDPNIKEVQKQCYVDVNLPPPESTAFMYVTEMSSSELSLRCAYKGKFLSVKSEDWIPPPLADLAERAKTSFAERAQWTEEPTKEVVEEIRKILRDFSSRGPRELLGWMRQLAENCKESIRLIIVDDTNYEIPWEILEYADQKYCGAHIAVVRWSKIQLFEAYSLLKVYEIKSRGSILAYLNDRELGEQQTYAERTILSILQGDLCQFMQELVDVLSIMSALTNVGMIYLGCHGNEGIMLGSHPSDRLTYIDLQIPIEHPDPRPIVFVNACDSARIKKSDGLLRVFLARYASGYIGTVGQVVSLYASKIAGCILQTAFTQPDGVQVAELLRQLRAEAVKMVTPKVQVRQGGSLDIIARFEQRELSEEEKYLYFLYTFMYVYYGNPLASLKLQAKRNSEP